MQTGLIIFALLIVLLVAYKVAVRRHMIFTPTQGIFPLTLQGEITPIEVNGIKAMIVSNPNVQAKEVYVYCYDLKRCNMTDPEVQSGINQLITSGVDVCVFDYPGYGAVTTVPSEVGCYETAVVVGNLMKGKYDKVTYYGERVGACVAYYASVIQGCNCVLYDPILRVHENIGYGLSSFLLNRYLFSEFNLEKGLRQADGSRVSISYSPFFMGTRVAGA